MPKFIERIFQVIQKIEAIILAYAMIGIAVLTIVNVFMRVLFEQSLDANEELSQFLIIVVTFVGLSYGASQGRHIRMTAFYDLLPDRPRKALMIFIAATTCILMFYLAWKAIDYVMVMEALGSVSPVLQVPWYLVYLAAPLGLILGGIQYFLTVVRNVLADEVYLSYEQKDEYEEPVSGEI